ncbi:phosphoethanolamine transferase [Variovorax sp. KK3]|uniref:sulfatase-like hydrolase/transferase n=1 Tax=Variovorax sp. KK3 TaxID=1855728 RepID=UPI00097C2C55|nr:phosphoethanolamine transferase [Variovorax sp. KK3]
MTVLPSRFPSDHRPQRSPALLALGVSAGTVLALIALGHDGRRAAQVTLLALPALAWLAWPVQGIAAHRLRTAFVWLWAMAFALDGVARAYLLDAYQAAPDSALVLGAAANTNGRESAEYLSMHWRSVAVWSATLFFAALLLARCARRGARADMHWPRWAIALLGVLLLVSALGYASKPWRRLHPLAYWGQWGVSVQALRASWADQQQLRSEALAKAKRAVPVVAREGPATIVLVIADSINRDNMSLYGYGRATTPRLQALKQQLDGDMVVLRNAWSADASTLPALRNILGFGQPASDDPQHVLALARAAGYKVWWMSNHDDLAIEQQHARLADVVEMVNRVPGRAGASLDGELLDCVQEALQDPAERKLIVVHLMGAHPHYSLRFPSGENPFDDHVDAVEAGLVKRGRSAWVRQFRHEYDAALMYHDFVVAETLQLTRMAGPAEEYRAWMYLSDHGQEVGHVSDRAGHSPSTASGYRIPTVIWRNLPVSPAAPADMERRPFRADWAAWTLADLLHIRWAGGVPSRNVLSDSYRWTAPVLPVDVATFLE